MKDSGNHFKPFSMFFINRNLLFDFQEKDLEMELGDDYILDLQSKMCSPFS